VQCGFCGVINLHNRFLRTTNGHEGHWAMQNCKDCISKMCVLSWIILFHAYCLFVPQL